MISKFNKPAWYIYHILMFNDYRNKELLKL